MSSYSSIGMPPDYPGCDEIPWIECCACGREALDRSEGLWFDDLCPVCHGERVREVAIDDAIEEMLANEPDWGISHAEFWHERV